MKKKKDLIAEELKLYNFKIEGQVRFSEVDSFDVVHNLQYFYFCEWARTKYFEYCGVQLDKDIFTKRFPIMTVHHEMDYFNPLVLGEKYNVFTRCSKIGETSIILENMITSVDGKIIIKLKSVMVYVDLSTNTPQRITDNIRKMIKKIEGKNLIMEN